MKARARELLDQATAAMLAAIEIYNKPRFAYRAQSFAILALNAWELLLKAEWLAVHKNYLPSLYVRQGGGPSRKRIKKTRAGNPMTHTLDYLADKLRDNSTLAENVCRNLQILSELRDSAVHFYCDNSEFEKRLHEIAAAAVTNFYAAARDWFSQNLSSLVSISCPLLSLRLTPRPWLHLIRRKTRPEVHRRAASIRRQDPGSPYAVAVNLELRFVRSKTGNATPVRVTNDSEALPVYLTEQDMLDRWPWTYDELTAHCRKRYSDFKADKKYHEIRRQLA